LFEPDVEAHDRILAMERRPAEPQADRVSEGRQALVSAPRGADPEERQAVDEAFRVFLVPAGEREREEATGSRHVAFPERMAGIAGKAGVENPADLGTSGEPGGNSKTRSHLALEPYPECPHAAQRQVHVIRAGAEAKHAVGVFQGAPR